MGAKDPTAPLSAHAASSLFGSFIRSERKRLQLTQRELAEKAGVGLRFIREVEQGKSTLRLDKINQVLGLFGCEAGPVPLMKHGEFSDA